MTDHKAQRDALAKFAKEVLDLPSLKGWTLTTTKEAEIRAILDAIDNPEEKGPQGCGRSFQNMYGVFWCNGHTFKNVRGWKDGEPVLCPACQAVIKQSLTTDRPFVPLEPPIRYPMKRFQSLEFDPKMIAANVIEIMEFLVTLTNRVNEIGDPNV